MIKKNELRVGSWVETMSIGTPQQYLQIKHGEEIDYCAVYNNPIVLTAEILEKCGFVWVNEYLSIDLLHARMRLAFCNGVSDKMTLFQFQGLPYDSAKEMPMNFGSNHPTNLHQLQNIYFSLTGGEELKIEF